MKHSTETVMNASLGPDVLHHENRRYLGSGGRSEENAVANFRPAFRDAETGIVYPSCFCDGRPAPCHLLDGLPDEVVLERDQRGGVRGVKPSLVSGFVRERRFYTRDEAAAWMRRHALH
jgi:hypothetical protein